MGIREDTKMPQVRKVALYGVLLYLVGLTWVAVQYIPNYNMYFLIHLFVSVLFIYCMGKLVNAAKEEERSNPLPPLTKSGKD